MQKWTLNRQLNITMLIQLALLGMLIIGSWVNLQKQLTLLRYDIDRLILAREKYCQKIEKINDDCIRFEYRLTMLEKN